MKKQDKINKCLEAHINLLTKRYNHLLDFQKIQWAINIFIFVMLIIIFILGVRLI